MIKFTIRLRPKLFNWITDQAQITQRSKSKMIVFLLEEAYSSFALGDVCCDPIHSFPNGAVTCVCGEKGLASISQLVKKELEAGQSNSVITIRRIAEICKLL